MSVFAESRNSDQIVVVAGRWHDFDNQTNQPSESLWQKVQNWGQNNTKYPADRCTRDPGRRYFDTEDDAASFLAYFFDSL